MIDKSKSIHLAAGIKVLKAEEFSLVQSAQEVLEKAHVDVADFLAKTKIECEELKKKAEEEGIAKGLAQWTEEISRCATELEEHKKEMEKVVIPLALKAAKKIVSREKDRQLKLFLKNYFNKIKINLDISEI